MSASSNMDLPETHLGHLRFTFFIDSGKQIGDLILNVTHLSSPGGIGVLEREFPDSLESFLETEKQMISLMFAATIEIAKKLNRILLSIDKPQQKKSMSANLFTEMVTFCTNKTT